MLNSYFKAVNFLRTTYATDNAIAGTVKERESYCHSLGVLASDYREKSYARAQQCGVVLEEQSVESLFGEVCEEQVRDIVRLHWSHNPFESWTQSAC